SAALPSPVLDYLALAKSLPSAPGVPAASGGSGFYTFLDAPASLRGVLFGNIPVLFASDLPALRAQFTYSNFFSIFGPLGTTIAGSLGVVADFAFGFDTFGFRRAFDTGNALRVADGFFVSDTAKIDGSGE